MVFLVFFFFFFYLCIYLWSEVQSQSKHRTAARNVKTTGKVYIRGRHWERAQGEAAPEKAENWQQQTGSEE